MSGSMILEEKFDALVKSYQYVSSSKAINVFPPQIKGSRMKMNTKTLTWRGLETEEESP